MDFWNSFWAAAWYALLIFALIASLIAMFAVITDLVRDLTLNGWWKAVWVLFLIFFPFITVFVYLIARGPGMAERGARAQRQEQHAAEDYIRQVAGTSPADEIAKARTLLEAGTITSTEFETIKRHALASTRPSVHVA